MAKLDSRETALATLLSSARHELRSPLQSIQGFAELLDCGAYGSLTAEQHGFVAHILQGSGELGLIMEACLELVELSVLGRQLEMSREDLHVFVGDALRRIERALGVTLPLRVATAAQTVRTKLDVSASRRALEAVVRAVSAGGHLALRAQLEADGEFGRLSVQRADAASASTSPLRTPEELAQQRHTSRSLVWLQLASALLAKQDGQLAATDNAERAEVRFRLSSTH